MTCWAGLSLGGIMVVRCAEEGEHVAHEGILPTETRASEPRAEGVEKRHVIYWYDTGVVRILEAEGA